MPDWILDLPAPLLAPLIMAIFAAAALAGLFVARRTFLPWLQVGPHQGEFLSSLHHGILMIYGLAVALIAIAVWESHSAASRTVSREATMIASVYRDVGGYPEPERGRLQGALRDYTHHIIHEAWPLQRRGEVPASGVALMDRFEGELRAFNPVTDGQKILHAETMRAHDALIEARRMRLDAVEERLPTALWGVILFGAVLSLVACYVFKVESTRLHYTMVGLLALLIGLVVFMITFYDSPFRGNNAVGSHAYELIYEQLMSP